MSAAGGVCSECERENAVCDNAMQMVSRCCFTVFTVERSWWWGEETIKGNRRRRSLELFWDEEEEILRHDERMQLANGKKEEAGLQTSAE